MTTTWPRYPHTESESADCAQCSYSSYQHSCGQQRIEHEGRALQSGVYPVISDTYPRPAPCCQVEQISDHHQAPVKSKREAKRERREQREREQREREQRHQSRSQDHHHRDRQHSQEPQHHQQQQQQQQQPSKHTSDQQQQQQQQQQQPGGVTDCVDCAAAAAATSGSAPAGITVSTGATVSASMQVDMSQYPGQRQSRDVEQGYAGTAKREREGVESGYSTQNRDDREKESKETGAKTGAAAKPDPDPIQYIEGEGCQVWRPQVGEEEVFFFLFSNKPCTSLGYSQSGLCK